MPGFFITGLSSVWITSRLYTFAPFTFSAIVLPVTVSALPSIFGRSSFMIAGSPPARSRSCRLYWPDGARCERSGMSFDASSKYFHHGSS